MRVQTNKKIAFSICLIIISIFISLFLVRPSAYAAENNENKPLVIYFYASVCASCNVAEESLNEVYDMAKASGKDIHLDVRMLNIEDSHNYELFQKYLDFYKVPEQDRHAPIIFFGDAWYCGKTGIQEGLQAEFEKEKITGAELLKVSGKDQERVQEKFSEMKAVNVFLAGLVGGFNPCSLSMLLFFISLIIARQASVLKMGLAFGAGKFITYLLLGTVLFNLLSKLHGGWFETFTKLALLLFVLVIAGLSIKDFFAARGEKYNKISTQLPTGLRKINHDWIKKFTSGANIKLLMLMSLLLGAIISVGEFLCTGQIYIASIAYIIQSNTVLTLRAFLYLVIYDVAFILPLIIITIIIDRGRGIFDVSEVLRAKLPAIKLVTGLAFLVFGVYIIFFL